MSRATEMRYALDTDALAYAMRRAGLDRFELAFRSGVPLGAIREWQRGVVRNPSASYLLQAAEALCVDPVDLMRPAQIPRWMRPTVESKHNGRRDV